MSLFLSSFIRAWPRLLPLSVLCLGALTLFGLATPRCAAATTYYVAPTGNDTNPGTLAAPFLTIQYGINTAINGDTVTVEDGTYTGPGNVDLDFDGKNITVTSLNGPASTIIDCGGSASANHRGFYLHRGETSAVISSLTIQNGLMNYSGSGQPSSSDGAGILNSSVSVTIQDCVFTNNKATSSYGFGGGISNLGSGIINVINCTLVNNYAEEGGGIFNSPANGGIVTLTNCNVTNNTSHFGGAGVYNTYNYRAKGGGTVTLMDCTLTGNIANGGSSNMGVGNGGGIFIDNEANGGTVSLIQCSVMDNTASYAGGGVYSINHGIVFYTNCTITGNTAQSPTADGGGGAYNLNYNMDCTPEVRQRVKVVYSERETTDYEPQTPYLYQRLQAANPARSPGRQVHRPSCPRA